MDKSFLKNVGLIGGSTVIIQIISFITVPIISRIYLPSELGEFSTVMSIAYIVLGVASLRLDQAIMLPKKISESIRIFHISVFLALIVSILILGACYIFYDNSFIKQILPENRYLIFFLPAIIFITKTNEIAHLFLNKLALYKINSKVNIVTSSVNRASIIGLGYALKGGGSILLFISQLLSETLSAIFKLRGIRIKTKYLIPSKVLSKKHRVLVREHKSFPIFDVWSTLLNTLSSQLVPILLAFFTTSAVVGMYSQGLKLIQLPLIFISSAIAQVFYKTASEKFKKNDNIKEFFEKTLYFLFVAGLFPSILISFFGPELFSFFLGNKWREAGEISQLLMPWVFFQFLGGTLSSIFLVYNKQKTLLRYTIVSFVSRFTVLTLMFHLFSIEYKIVLFVFSFLSVLLYIYVLLLLFKITSTNPINFLRNIKIHFALFFVLILFFICLKIFIDYNYSTIIVLVALSSIYYVVLFKKTNFGVQLRSVLKKNSGVEF